MAAQKACQTHPKDLSRNWFLGLSKALKGLKRTLKGQLRLVEAVGSSGFPRGHMEPDGNGQNKYFCQICCEFGLHLSGAHGPYEKDGGGGKH